jgi:predicted nucleic acid-binding protein
VLRIVGHRGYPGFKGGPARVAPMLAAMMSSPGHQFWPDDVSLLDAARVDASRLLAAQRLTDTYLLALAVAHGGRLATLDGRLSGEAVRGGAAALCHIRPAE